MVAPINYKINAQCHPNQHFACIDHPNLCNLKKLNKKRFEKLRHCAQYCTFPEKRRHRILSMSMLKVVTPNEVIHY